MPPLHTDEAASAKPAPGAAQPAWWSSARMDFKPWMSGAGRALRAYSDWLASISWWRFFLLAILFVAAISILTDMPFFQVEGRAATKVRYVVHVDDNGAVSITPEDRKAGSKRNGNNGRKDGSTKNGAANDTGTTIAEADLGDDPSKKANVRVTPEGVVIDAHDGGERKRITIDKQGVRIEKTPLESAPAAPAASASAPATQVPVAPAAPKAPTAPAAPAVPAVPGDPGVTADNLGQAADALAARAERSAKIEESLAEAVSNLEDLANDRETASRRGALGNTLQSFSGFFVLFSLIMKIEAGRRVKVEVVAAEATEWAEAEQLKRQLAEARVQTMQAQVEPHFLFNTLASIDHLIETDPPRASAMQKNLIQYLRAALPKMRESSTTLGREVDLVRAYLEILKVRMDERLTTEFAVPDGLRSAAFPPMMLQTIVENAIKHGLEPKPDGGAIRVAAEIVDGRLRVTVADTGLGFDPDNTRTRGTGLGLTNIRERLAMLHEGKGSLAIAPNQPSGTVVSIELPYTFAKSS